MSDIPGNVDLAFKAAEVLSIFGGGSFMLVKLGRAVERFEILGALQSKEIAELKTEVVTMRNVITQVALQNERLDQISKRINNQDETILLMRKGEGYIFPLRDRVIEAK